MTPEQIEKWAREADEYAYEGYSELARMLNHRDRAWHEKRDTKFARLVSQDTWERARNVCFAVDETGDYVCHTRDDCANAIDAAAAQEAKS